MKAKKLYQISLVLGGLLLAFSGVACMVTGTLLDHDSVLMTVHESRSRTYYTQYWLGLPLILFGGLLMLISPSLHKRKRASAFNIFVCIPLISCALVAAVLHGTAYAHFLSIQQNRLYLKDHRYLCTEVNTDLSVCECSKRDLLQRNARIKKEFPVPCSQQKSLVTFHGALLTFSIIAFSLLLGILVICVIFILHVFKIQLEINSPTSGQENAGYSHGRRRALSPPNPAASPGATFHGLHDRPPSYESLMTSFSVTSLNMTSRDATNDITRDRNRPVSRQTRVRYRGESSSRLNHGIPEQEESSSNEALNSDEPHGNANAEAQMMQIDELDVTDSPNSNSASLSRSYVRQISDQLDSTIRAITEDIRVLSNAVNNDVNDNNNYEVNDSTRSESEGQREAVSLELNNVRPEQNYEAVFQGRTEETPRDIRPAHRERMLIQDSSNLRTSEATPERIEQSRISTRPSIDRERRWTNESRNTRSLLNNEPISESRRIRNPPVVAQEENNSSLTHHRPLQRTLSNHSESGVYIDIRQSFVPAQNSAPSDSARIAVRYRGQLDSNSVNRIANRSQLAHERENRTDATSVNLHDVPVQNTQLSDNSLALTRTQEFVDSSENTTANESLRSTTSNTESTGTAMENHAIAPESPLASIEEGMHSLDSNNETSSSQSGQESVPLRDANLSVSFEDRSSDSAVGQRTENRAKDNREFLI